MGNPVEDILVGGILVAGSPVEDTLVVGILAVGGSPAVEDSPAVESTLVVRGNPVPVETARLGCYCTRHADRSEHSLHRKVYWSLL